MSLFVTKLPIFMEHDATLVPLSIYHLSKYDGDTRHLILQAKIKCNATALEQILKNTAAHLDHLPLNQGQIKIIAAPSSLWSRVYGRYDIAASMAEYLAKNVGAPRVAAPFKFHWQIRKRAHQKKLPLEETPIFPMSHSTQIWLIDDIATTGHTLSRLALPFLRQGYPVSAFVYAVAGRHLSPVTYEYYKGSGPPNRPVTDSLNMVNSRSQNLYSLDDLYDRENR